MQPQRRRRSRTPAQTGARITFEPTVGAWKIEITAWNSHGVEWSAAILNFAFTTLAMNRVYAQQLARHPLAGRVLFGIGMAREGLVRKRVFKGDLVEEVICWGTLRDSWNRQTSN
jgi:RimJ/RimL family protein N-acetyltransferase